MRNASLNRSILTLAIPAIVANITTPLLSLVDLAIVGHLGSAAFVGAIAVGGSIFNMIYWLFGFLRFGTSGLTAQAYGRGDERERMLTACRSLLIALSAGLLLIVFQTPLGRLSMALMVPDDATATMAMTYYNVLIYGAPAVMAQYAMSGWFVGSQDTRTPMIVSLSINCINIAASLLLVYVYDLGIRGVAFGTLIAQWFGAAIAVLVAVRKGVFKLPGIWSDLFDRGALRHFFVVNVAVIFRTLCLIAVTVWFTRAGAAQGAVMLAVNTLLLQLFTLFSYFMDGFAFAAEALCGKYYGAGDDDGLRRCIKRFILWGGGVALAFTALYAAGGASFLAMLTNDGIVLDAAREFRLWSVAVPLAGFMAFTFDGVVVGLTRTRLMMQSMAVASALFFVLWFALEPSLGNHALWIAFLAYLMARGVILYWWICRK